MGGWKGEGGERWELREAGGWNGEGGERREGSEGREGVKGGRE